MPKEGEHAELKIPSSKVGKLKGFVKIRYRSPGAV
jgi:hypothetical protein